MDAHSPTAFASRELAERAESLAARELVRFVETALRLDPRSPAALLEVGGGVAAFVLPDSPVNRAIGLGLRGDVTAADIERIEEFYAVRGAVALLGLCPLARPSLVAARGARGWVVEGFENVMFRPVVAQDRELSASNVDVREALTSAERDTWRRTAAAGFCAPLPPLDAQLELGELVVNRPGTKLYTAFVDDVPAATGELYITREVAWLSADATLPRYRGKGLQAHLQRHRLGVAARAGCSVAVSEATPGSASQRNMERLGFRVAYTRIDVTPGR